MQNINNELLIIIFCVAVGTYTLRLSGILISNKLKKIKHIDLFLESIPSTLLIALIFPAITKEGVIGIISAFLVIVCMYKTNNVIVSMILGVLIVALYRNI